MDSVQIAPEGERCMDVGWVAGTPWNCMCRVGHDGAHAAEPAPGETVAWPKLPTLELPKAPLGPFGLKRDTPEEQLRRSGVAFSWAEARRSRAEELEVLYAAEQAQDARHNAVALAVEALKPLAGAHIGDDAYADAIIRVADKLGAYIQGGEVTHGA